MQLLNNVENRVKHCKKKVNTELVDVKVSLRIAYSNQKN